MAIIQQGMLRATESIELLVERSRENHLRVRKALQVLPDQAVREVNDSDLDDYVVVRVADEIVVDLMLSACGVTYDQTAGEIEEKVIDGVTIPFASKKLLLQMKQTMRDKDIPDRLFLQEEISRAQDR
jgi:hypothetical protein